LFFLLIWLGLGIGAPFGEGKFASCQLRLDMISTWSGRDTRLWKRNEVHLSA
jgi:hypothetical protein